MKYSVGTEVNGSLYVELQGDGWNVEDDRPAEVVVVLTEDDIVDIIKAIIRRGKD